jgi:transglutaminase-like putative cysteine protease
MENDMTLKNAIRVRRSALTCAAATGLIGFLLAAPASAGAEEESERGAAAATRAEPRVTATYAIEIDYLLPDLAVNGDDLVRFWAWLPLDDADQRVLDMQVLDAAGRWSVRQVASTGDRLIYLEGRPSAADQPILRTRAIIERVRVDSSLPDATQEPDSSMRELFAEDLRDDVPNMEITDRIRDMAHAICGEEQHPLTQARLIYDEVIRTSDHYSKGAVKASTIGSASYCLENAGGSCTDMHSLFIALCRARGIPARLTFGMRLNPDKLGEMYDPGYRCWAHIFIPEAGWIPVEVAAGDTVSGQQDFYFGGLDENRIAMVHGRNLELEPAPTMGRVNITPKSAYAEVNGQPIENISRLVRFMRVNESPDQRHTQNPN